MIFTLHIPINKVVEMITQTHACAHITHTPTTGIQPDQTTLMTFSCIKMLQQFSTTITPHD
jgi:hypothetical protein